MVRLLIILSWITFWASSLVAQNVSVVAEYNDFRVAGDMQVAASGHVYVCGHFNLQPFIMKFDSVGNELWIKYFPEDEEEYGFGRLLIDESENLYLHKSKPYSRADNFIVKVDSSGALLWKSDSIQGERAIGYPSVNFTERENDLYIIHDSRENTDDNAAPMISQLNKETGNIIYQSPIIVETSLPYIIKAPPFVDNAWVLSCASGVLNVAEDASYNYIPLGDSVPGILAAATSNGYITYTSELEQFTDGFGRWRSKAYKYNFNWDLELAIELNPKSYSLHDTFSFPVRNIIPIQNKGFVLAAQPDTKLDTNLFGNIYFGQINPDNMTVVWDTTLNYDGGINILATNYKAIYALEGLGLSQTGIRLYKIEVPDITYESEFITNVEQVVEQPVFSKVYPNPSNTLFTLEANEVIQTIELYALDGRLVLTENVQQEVYNFNVYNNGIYILRMAFQNGAVETQRIVKW